MILAHVALPICSCMSPAGSLRQRLQRVQSQPAVTVNSMCSCAKLPGYTGLAGPLELELVGLARRQVSALPTARLPWCAAIATARHAASVRNRKHHPRRRLAYTCTYVLLTYDSQLPISSPLLCVCLALALSLALRPPPSRSPALATDTPSRPLAGHIHSTYIRPISLDRQCRPPNTTVVAPIVPG